MKTSVRPNVAVLMLLLLILVVGISLGLLITRPIWGEKLWKKQPVDPHEGQVYIYDGFDWVWMTPLEGVPVNAFTQEDFSFVDGVPTYLGRDYQVLKGVDVSEHQYDIDWQQVADAGVDFAYIRIGRRGYTEGGLFGDPWFEKNYQGAKAAGLQVGVYFYSQAVTAEEALEEAEFVLTRLGGRPLDLPVVYDWEKVDNEDAEIARTRDLDLETRTDCAVAFCERMKQEGLEASIYFNRNLGYYGYDLRRLTDYRFWFALPELSWPSFYYRVDIWQYSFTEVIPGIEGETDMNLMFVPVKQPEAPAETETEA